MAAPKRKFDKVKRKVLTGGKTEYRAWKDWKEGDRLVCKLVAKQKNKKYKNKVDYVVEVLEVEFASGKEQKRIEKAERLTLNSMGQLDKAMKNVEEGDEIEIIYNGMNTIEGGDWEGSESHTCEVALIGGEDEDSDDDDEDEDDEDEDDEDEDDSDDDDEDEEDESDDDDEDEDSDDEDEEDEDDEDEDEDSDEDDEDDEEEDRKSKKKSKKVETKKLSKKSDKKSDKKSSKDKKKKRNL